MTVQELINEANTKRNTWYNKPEDGFLFIPYYGGTEDYILWLKRTIKHLKQNFSTNEDAKRFMELGTNKTSNDSGEFEEMICCLQMLVDEKTEESIVINEKELIDLTIIDKAPGYITDVLKEANECYKYSIYNGCAILLRKVTENLIIEAFDKNNRIDEIKDSNGDFLMLKGLIEKLLKANPQLWNISRNTKKSLEEIKKIGDLSAHNIKFSARKGDIDKIIGDYRLALEEIYKSIY